MLPHRPRTRLLAGGFLIVGLLAPIASPAPARAADDGLRIVADTTYEALPAEGRVRVTINASATNTTPDTAAGRTYFTGLSFALPPRIENVSAVSGDVALPLVVRERADDFTGVEVTFHRQVFFEQTYRYRVAFDLADAGDAPDRDVRVTPSVVAFPVWAFGSSDVPGSSVSVHLPAGYRPTVEGGPLNAASNGDGTTLAAVDLPDPFAFFAYLSADKPGAFVETQTSVDIAGSTAPVIVRAWEDDARWGARMTDLMERGIPALIDLIGLPYPVNGRLRVEEAATSRLGEYAGTYNDITELITIRYDADPVVALHEAAHIWFNDDLLRGRWIGEAWAEFYAVAASEAIGETGDVYELTDADLEHRIPLNDWGGLGVEDLGIEDFAYAATYHVATLIAERTDLEGLRRVWRAVEEAEMSYQPPDAPAGAEPETGAAARQEDWQRLLDLLEERTGATYDDLWREWIVNESQAAMLDRRAEARAAYASAIEAAAPWQLPRQLRFDLGTWRFDEVEATLATAGDVLEHRDAIAGRAAALELEPSDALRTAFESSDGMAAAEAAGIAELATLDALERATATVAASTTALESVGLLGSDPAARLASARNAYEAGELDRADAEAAEAIAQRAGAEEAGRLRVGIAGATIFVLDLAAMGLLALRRRRGSVPPPAATAA